MTWRSSPINTMEGTPQHRVHIKHLTQYCHVTILVFKTYMNFATNIRMYNALCIKKFRTGTQSHFYVVISLRKRRYNVSTLFKFDIEITRAACACCEAINVLFLFCIRNFDSSILQIPWPILVILLRTFGFIAFKTLKLFGFPIFRF